jgi:hypothetical protein
VINYYFDEAIERKLKNENFEKDELYQKRLELVWFKLKMFASQIIFGLSIVKTGSS